MLAHAEHHSARDPEAFLPRHQSCLAPRSLIFSPGAVTQVNYALV